VPSILIIIPKPPVGDDEPLNLFTAEAANCEMLRSALLLAGDVMVVQLL
jgi:hypothetical protein